MTFVPLAGITQMVFSLRRRHRYARYSRLKAIDAKSESVDLEHISYWLQKYEGHISAGICSAALHALFWATAAQTILMIAYSSAIWRITPLNRNIHNKRTHLKYSSLPKNGYVHQITNIDGENKIFDICNCNVKICNALRTSLLFNTPYLFVKRLYRQGYSRMRSAASALKLTLQVP